MQPNATTTYILLGDDDEEDQELLKESLARQLPAADITTVWNGEQVLAYLETCPDDHLPCLIILDYKMPILNGVETLERLCGNARYASIPVAVWSTTSQREYIDNCLSKGATRFFVKPNDPQELLKITTQLLSLCRNPV